MSRHATQLERVAVSITNSHARSFIRYSKLGLFRGTMAEGQIDLFRQAVRNMLAALRMLDVGDTKLHDLTLCFGHTDVQKRTHLRGRGIISR